jgi:hypothetical protein
VLGFSKKFVQIFLAVPTAVWLELSCLEKIGDSDARSLLKSLAAGAPQARLTLEAREALQRLEDIARRSSHR